MTGGLRAASSKLTDRMDGRFAASARSDLDPEGVASTRAASDADAWCLQ